MAISIAKLLFIGIEIEVFILLGVICILSLMYLYYHRFHLVDKAALYFSEDNSLHKTILNSCPSLHLPYSPPIWLFSSHLQGSLGLVLRKSLKIPYETEVVTNVNDGAELILKWSNVPKEDAPTLLILPGLTGGSDKQYITHLVDEAKQRNWRSVVLIFPGCLVEGTQTNPCKSPRFFSPLDLSDLGLVLSHIQARYPQSTIIGVGHSMGAGMLVKYVSQCGAEGKDPILKACFSLSNPWNYSKVVRNLEQTFIGKNIYNKHFAGYWFNVYFKNHEVFNKIKVDHEVVSKTPRTMRNLDHILVKAVYGYDEVEKYYEDVSCYHTVSHVNIPLFVVHAMDDPVVPPDALPLDALRQNKNCFVACTKSGGHTGWLEGFFPSGLCFADKLCLEIIETFLNEMTPMTTAAQAVQQKKCVKRLEDNLESSWSPSKITRTKKDRKKDIID